MSKAEILEEIAKMTPAERGELWEALWDLEERLLVEHSPVTEEEKAILDRAYEEYLKNPEEGAPWEEVEARLRLRK